MHTNEISQQPTHPAHRPRVLVVDNDQAIREDHIRNLGRWGYEAVVAQGEGPLLLHDAERQARARHCQIALVDMRLLDDHDRDDTSGLGLISKLKPAVSIVVSAHGDRTTLIEALREQQAFDFVGKEEGPRRLREALDSVALRMCACRHDCAIRWAAGFSSERVAATLFPHDPHIPPDEVDDLLCRLFPEAAEIALAPLQTEAAAPVERTSDPTELLLKAQRTGAASIAQEPVLVQLAPVAAIRAERTAYKTYVAEQIGSGRTPLLLCDQEAWDLGALVYTFISPSLPLRCWYATADIPAVQRLLTELFRDVLGLWYSHTEHKLVNLYQHYLPELDVQTLGQYSGTLAPGLPNPVAWLVDHAAQSQRMVHWSVTHCNLHADTILVDRFDRSWITDFKRVGPGPALRDFARLETDIRLRLLAEAHVDSELVHALDIALFAPRSAQDQPIWRRPVHGDDTGDALDKAFAAICTIRRLASALTKFQSMDEYYWILLLETLVVARHSQPAQPATARAFQTAALLCERLERWATVRPVPS